MNQVIVESVLMAPSVLGHEYGHIAPNCTKPSNDSKPRSSNSIKETKLVSEQANLKFNHKLVNINNHTIDSLIDPGSDLSLLRKDVYEQMGSPPLENKKQKLWGIGESEIQTLGCLRTKVGIDDSVFDIILHVVDIQAINLQYIIGNDILRGTQNYFWER